MNMQRLAEWIREISIHIFCSLLVTNVANVHMTGYVNKHNFRCWAPNNPQEAHEIPVYIKNAIVWCSVGMMGVIGPYFF